MKPGRLLTCVIVAEAVVVAAGGVWLWHRSGSQAASLAAAPLARLPESDPLSAQQAAASPRAPAERGAQGILPGRSSEDAAHKAAIQRPAERIERTPLGRLRRPRVVIEKSAKVLKLYDGPSLVRTYPVIVGWQEGDKQREGDFRTPEGEFYVCIRKGRGQTQYVRALGLSYPEVEDAQRGLEVGLITSAQHRRILEAISRRSIPPWETPLGGEIMIHGTRRNAQGQVRDGTEGCIAMEDADVIELYAVLPLGAAVAIWP